MRCIRMTVAYDGTNYHGWQEQPGQATVQGALVQALATVLGERPAVEGAGRTDAGVHALGQVAAFKTEHAIGVDRLHAAVNSCLPPDIAVTGMREVALGFRPSLAAVSKHYRYRIYRGPVRPVFEARYVWHWYRPLAVEPMRQAARLLVGRHDFKSFEGRGSARQDTVREVTRLDVVEAGPELHFEVEGNRFLYRMVRSLVGTLTEVGRGHRPVEWAAEVLAARDRMAAGPTAPPHGLCLVEVRYPPGM
ncbi:MAG: tRNA pseudouridine(38-40) synthase TruA [Planctomycetes bacterium]|nr:tRNA pseudouridine(38-40) synthase TruA [Planctomycetota bacterium]